MSENNKSALVKSLTERTIDIQRNGVGAMNDDELLEYMVDMTRHVLGSIFSSGKEKANE